MSGKIVYPGKDLEAMSFAVNYHKWIIDEFRPFLGKDIVEVGAGTGDFSTLLLDETPDSLSLVEPSEMFEILQQSVLKKSSNTKIRSFNSIFANIADELKVEQKPDSIIYVNVMEHIEEDEKELKIIHETLEPNGKVFIFVPALKFLYGEFDKKIGHFRRYTKRELVKKVEEAGFEILKVKYFDILGIAPWFLKYQVLRSNSLESSAVEVYDKFIVPFAKKLESFSTPVVGKNILLVAQKVV